MDARRLRISEAVVVRTAGVPSGFAEVTVIADRHIPADEEAQAAVANKAAVSDTRAAAAYTDGIVDGIRGWNRVGPFGSQANIACRAVRDQERPPVGMTTTAGITTQAGMTTLLFLPALRETLASSR
jgi:hypothetical protein